MLQALTQWVIENISVFGYTAVIVLMALESANIPIPSEVVLPFAGFLASNGDMNFHLAAFAGALGCLLGSILSYIVGRWLGRAFLERHGKWFLVGHKQMEFGDKWVSRYGNWVSFFSRLLPVVRTFISFVLGIWKAPFWAFAVLTFVGSWMWSYFLVYVGYVLGENWVLLKPLWEKFDIAIVAVVVVGIAFYVYRHVKGK